MKKQTILFIILIILAFFAGSLYNKLILTGNVIQSPENNSYSYTKAVCNQNQCLDVLIECNQGKVKNITPVSKLIELPNFIDPRNLTDFCE